MTTRLQEESGPSFATHFSPLLVSCPQARGISDIGAISDGHSTITLCAVYHHNSACMTSKDYPSLTVVEEPATGSGSKARSGCCQDRVQTRRRRVRMVNHKHRTPFGSADGSGQTRLTSLSNDPNKSNKTTEVSQRWYTSRARLDGYGQSETEMGKAGNDSHLSQKTMDIGIKTERLWIPSLQSSLISSL